MHWKACVDRPSSIPVWVKPQHPAEASFKVQLGLGLPVVKSELAHRPPSTTSSGAAWLVGIVHQALQQVCSMPRLANVFYSAELWRPIHRKNGKMPTFAVGNTSLRSPRRHLTLTVQLLCTLAPAMNAPLAIKAQRWMVHTNTSIRARYNWSI